MTYAKHNQSNSLTKSTVTNSLSGKLDHLNSGTADAAQDKLPQGKAEADYLYPRVQVETIREQARQSRAGKHTRAEGKGIWNKKRDSTSKIKWEMIDMIRTTWTQTQGDITVIPSPPLGPKFYLPVLVWWYFSCRSNRLLRPEWVAFGQSIPAAQNHLHRRWWKRFAS